MATKTVKIDARGKTLGRLASTVAQVLIGKDKADYVPYKIMGDMVVIENVKEIKFTGNKLEQKKYYHHSGYLGGLKEKPMKEVFERDPAEVLRRAVIGMLPKNKLRSKMMKRLSFK
ncbi:MAG: 50S ribosomal protein L13 [bacterium]